MNIFNKYSNKKIMTDGYTFDSKKENQRYLELKLLLKGKKISVLTVHPEYELVAKSKHGKALKYISDFAYIDLGLEQPVIEDVKGFRTALYKFKKRLFLEKYNPMNFREL